MDLFEKFSSKFGNWYEGLFGAGSGELRPRDILRKITTAMEDNRKEGFDGKVYVPNRYVLELAVDDPEERDYLLSFLDEEELVSVLQRFMAQNHYHTRAPLDFTIAELDEAGRAVSREKLRVKARFEKGGATRDEPIPATPAADALRPRTLRPSTSAQFGASGMTSLPAPRDDVDDDLPTVASATGGDEDGTVPAIAWAALAITAVDGRKSHHSLTRAVTTIGRSRNSGNDILLSGDGMVSKQHARIEREPGNRYVIADLGSMNGVVVNNVRIDHRSPLANGDEVLIGATRLVFQQADVDSGRSDVVDVPDLVAGGRAARLSCDGREYVLGSDSLVGRALTADVVLDDPSVSMRHARIIAGSAGRFVLEDLGSSRGTRVNGRPALAGQRIFLSHGDVVTVGTRVLQFFEAGR
ncbi:MAG: FhaA domain-containing protein [Capsulimonadaceae bacterium]